MSEETEAWTGSAVHGGRKVRKEDAKGEMEQQPTSLPFASFSFLTSLSSSALIHSPSFIRPLILPFQLPFPSLSLSPCPHVPPPRPSTQHSEHLFLSRSTPIFPPFLPASSHPSSCFLPFFSPLTLSCSSLALPALHNPLDVNASSRNHALKRSLDITNPHQTLTVSGLTLPFCFLFIFAAWSCFVACCTLARTPLLLPWMSLCAHMSRVGIAPAWLAFGRSRWLTPRFLSPLWRTLAQSAGVWDMSRGDDLRALASQLSTLGDLDDSFLVGSSSTSASAGLLARRWCGEAADRVAGQTRCPPHVATRLRERRVLLNKSNRCMISSRFPRTTWMTACTRSGRRWTIRWHFLSRR